MAEIVRLAALKRRSDTRIQPHATKAMNTMPGTTRHSATRKNRLDGGRAAALRTAPSAAKRLSQGAWRAAAPSPYSAKSLDTMPR